MKKEQIIQSLKNAPVIRNGEFIDLHFELKELGVLEHMEKVKGLWLLTSYGREYCYSMIADMDCTEADEGSVSTALGILIPHNTLYKLSSDVLGEEEGYWFTGIQEVLQKEIEEGRVRTLYLNKNWGDKP